MLVVRENFSSVNTLRVTRSALSGVLPVTGFSSVALCGSFGARRAQSSRAEKFAPLAEEKSSTGALIDALGGAVGVNEDPS